jgi:hypothetical protein
VICKFRFAERVRPFPGGTSGTGGTASESAGSGGTAEWDWWNHVVVKVRLTDFGRGARFHRSHQSVPRTISKTAAVPPVPPVPLKKQPLLTAE